MTGRHRGEAELSLGGKSLYCFGVQDTHEPEFNVYAALGFASLHSTMVHCIFSQLRWSPICCRGSRITAKATASPARFMTSRASATAASPRAPTNLTRIIPAFLGQSPYDHLSRSSISRHWRLIDVWAEQQQGSLCQYSIT